jgi:hypothetical protein
MYIHGVAFPSFVYGRMFQKAPNNMFTTLHIENKQKWLVFYTLHTFNLE